MQKLLSGRRLLTPIGALAALAVVCLCLGSLLLTLDYRGQLHDTRIQLAHTAAAFVSTQSAAYRACLLRNVEHQVIAGLERADAREQQSLLKIEAANKTVGAKIRAELLQTFGAKYAADAKLLTVPPVDCSGLQPRIVTSSSRGR